LSVSFAEPEVVLHVASVVADECVDRRRHRRGARAARIGRRQPEQEARERVALIRGGNEGIALRPLLVEIKIAARGAIHERIGADLAEVGAVLERVPAGGLGNAAVQGPRSVVHRTLRPRAECRIAGDVAVGKAPVLDVFDEGVVELQLRQVVRNAGDVIAEERPTVAQRHDRRRARDDRVVQRDHVDAPHLIALIGSGIRKLFSPEMRVRLVGVLVQIEAGYRYLVVQLVLTLEDVLFRLSWNRYSPSSATRWCPG
jgi:hypothetical protein